MWYGMHVSLSGMEALLNQANGSCCCCAGGNLYGMGSNALGQLGTGTAANLSVPTLLGVGILAEGKVLAIGAGAFDTVVVQGM